MNLESFLDIEDGLVKERVGERLLGRRYDNAVAVDIGFQLHPASAIVVFALMAVVVTSADDIDHRHRLQHPPQLPRIHRQSRTTRRTLT